MLIFVTQVVFAVGKVTLLYEFELLALEVMMMENMETGAGNCVTNNTGPVSVVFALMNSIRITTCCLAPEWNMTRCQLLQLIVGSAWIGMLLWDVFKSYFGQGKTCRHFINIIPLSKKFDTCEHTLELLVYSLHCRCVTNTKWKFLCYWLLHPLKYM